MSALDKDPEPALWFSTNTNNVLVLGGWAELDFIRNTIRWHVNGPINLEPWIAFVPMGYRSIIRAMSVWVRVSRCRDKTGVEPIRNREAFLNFTYELREELVRVSRNTGWMS